MDLDVVGSAEVAVQPAASCADDDGAVDALGTHPSFSGFGIGVEHDERLAGDDAKVHAALAPSAKVALAEMKTRPILEECSLAVEGHQPQPLPV